ncbi:calcium-binding protein [Shimia sp. SDUM112013]|uniref:calcium-binding protein n=1 Tax=Shimia sp. SDUM112013 TaxID=3136160 RepID=UPI0032EFDDC2
MASAHFTLSNGNILSFFDFVTNDYRDAAFRITAPDGNQVVDQTLLSRLDGDGAQDIIYFEETTGGGFEVYRYAGFDANAGEPLFSVETFDAAGVPTGPVTSSDRFVLFGAQNFDLLNTVRQEGWIQDGTGTFFLNEGGALWINEPYELSTDSAFEAFPFDGTTIIDTQQGFVVAGFQDEATSEPIDPGSLFVSFIDDAIETGTVDPFTASEIQSYADRLNLTDMLLSGNQEFRQYIGGGANGVRFDSIDTLRMDDGHILVVWSGYIADGVGYNAPVVSEGLYAAVVNANGAIEVDPYLLVAGPEADTDGGFGVTGLLYWPRLVGLQDGSFALIHQADTARLNSGDDTIVRHFSADRTALETLRIPDADARDIFVGPGGEVFSLRASAVADEAVLRNVGDAPDQPMNLTGTDGDDILQGGDANDRLDGLAGNDILQGGDGADTLIGGAGNDQIFGGLTDADLRDVVFGGDGNDTIQGGAGNDELRGDAGNDDIAGGAGADTVIGGAGDDVMTGSNFGDLIFGGDGFDFVNGGFGSDRVNGGNGADRFFHVGVAGHGSDWIQDYDAAEGDLLLYGGSATINQFQVNRANTANAGEASVDEAFVIYKPTGQILWALVDGFGNAEINIRIAGVEYDLLA